MIGISKIIRQRQTYRAVDTSCESPDVHKNDVDFKKLETEMIVYWKHTNEFVKLLRKSSGRDVVSNIAMKNFVDKYGQDNHLNILMQKLSIDIKELRAQCYQKNLHIIIHRSNIDDTDKDYDSSEIYHISDDYYVHKAIFVLLFSYNHKKMLRYLNNNTTCYNFAYKCRNNTQTVIKI